MACQGSSSGFVTLSRFRMFAAGESFLLDREVDLAIAHQGGGAFVIGTIDSQNQAP